jgi:hypothetical protein
MAQNTAQSQIEQLLKAIPGLAGGGMTGGPAGLGSGIGGALGTILGATGTTGAGGPIGGMIGSALGSATGAGLAALPDLLKSDYEKSNEKRLKDLKRRQELGTLGLSEREKAAMSYAGNAAVEKAAQDIRALQGGTAASLATGAGIAASQAQMANEALLQRKADVAQSVLEQDLAEKRAQEQELEQRGALASDAKTKRISTGVSIAATGIQSAEEGIRLAKQVRGRAPSGNEIKQFMEYTGIKDPKRAAEVFQLMGASSPEQQELLSGMLFTPSPQGVLTAPDINVPKTK